MAQPRSVAPNRQLAASLLQPAEKSTRRPQFAVVSFEKELGQ